MSPFHDLGAHAEQECGTFGRAKHGRPATAPYSAERRVFYAPPSFCLVLRILFSPPTQIQLPLRTHLPLDRRPMHPLDEVFCAWRMCGRGAGTVICGDGRGTRRERGRFRARPTGKQEASESAPSSDDDCPRLDIGQRALCRLGITASASRAARECAGPTPALADLW